MGRLRTLTNRGMLEISRHYGGLRFDVGLRARLIIAFAFLFSLWTVFFAMASQAEERRPLLMPGKKTLYQRILSRPGATLHASPDAPGHAKVPALSVFFVYDRLTSLGKQWLEVGLASKEPTLGWLEAEKAIDWKQTLTVAFTRTGGREPTLFFRDRDKLVELMESEHMVRDIDRFRDQITKGDIPQGFPIISIEPDTYPHPNEGFYLLPILNFDEVFFESGHKAKVLNVAAVTLQEGDVDMPGKEEFVSSLASSTPLLRDFRTGVVFVIDSTASMGPYINRTREAVRRIYRKLKESPWGQSMSFGLVAYRDNVQARPGLEYVSRIFATLEDGLDESTFFRRVNEVKPASVPSKGFNEDAYAGVYDAIKEIDWQGYAGRFIVLITDAGARRAKDPLSRTKYDAERLRNMAQEKDQEMQGAKIAILVMHLLTPEGRHTHEGASTQYRVLSQWGDIGSLYFSVQNGAVPVPAFGRQVDLLLASLLQLVEGAQKGMSMEVPPAGAATELERNLALVGRAMQLAYLGRVAGSEVPPLINAWVVDRDFVTLHNSLEVRVLITKNQLSDLQETLQAIFKAGEETGMSPKDFFAQLSSAAATMARDPNRLNQVEVRRLADVGLIGEWLEDLPYKSTIMHLTEREWLGWSYGKQEEFLNEVEQKIRYYNKIHNEVNRWIGDKGEAITTILLDDLP